LLEPGFPPYDLAWANEAGAPRPWCCPVEQRPPIRLPVVTLSIRLAYATAVALPP